MSCCNVSLQIYPTEILTHIFKYVPLKQLCRWRQVCLRWKDIIDSLVSKDSLWQVHCKADFGTLSEIAHTKAKPEITWCNIYRSLSLWPKVSTFEDVNKEIAIVPTLRDGIRDFNILNGIIGVLTNCGIFYYDIETLEPVKSKISGSYRTFRENEDTLVILGLHLYIIRKYRKNPDFQNSITINSITQFILVNRSVYYVTQYNEIYVCDLDTCNFHCTFVIRISEAVISISYCEGQIYIKTKKSNIYKVIGHGEILIICNLLNDLDNELYTLNTYNFLEQTYTSGFHNGWHSDAIKLYGNILIVGTVTGILKIYYLDSIKDIKIYEHIPMKQYNLDMNNEGICYIYHIDVVEGNDKHIIFVGLEQKVVKLILKHFP